jgi:predicted amidohydrolase
MIILMKRLRRRLGFLLLAYSLSIFLVTGHALAEESNQVFTVALLQMKPDKDNVTANLDMADKYCRQAAVQGADVALLPEMWSSGYTGFDPHQAGAREAFRAKALRKESEAIQHFAALARELNMAIGVPYLQEFSPAPRNALTLFDRHGKEMFTYAKVHTCDFVSMEAATWPGDSFYAADLDTKGGVVRVGAMICFDREQPESARLLMLKGAEIILTPNACGLDELRLDQFKIRAWENSVGTAMVNYPAPYQNGQSIAFDAEGKCLVKAGTEEGIFLARFDINKLRKTRASSIWANAYRRPHRYQDLITTNKDPIWHRLNADGANYDASKR